MESVQAAAECILAVSGQHTLHHIHNNYSCSCFRIKSITESSEWFWSNQLIWVFFLGGGGKRASNNSVRRSFIILVCSFGSGGMQSQWESCKPFSPLFPPPSPPLTFRLVLIVTPYCTSAVYITCNVDLENIVMNQIVASGWYFVFFWLHFCWISNCCCKENLILHHWWELKGLPLPAMQ